MSYHKHPAHCTTLTGARFSRLAGSGLALPLLHSVGGQANYWDEALSFGLIALIVAVLGILAYLGSRGRKKKGRDRARLH